MATLLVPDRNRSEASYIAVRTVTLQYPAGSSVSQELDGVNERLTFSANGTAQDPGATGQLIMGGFTAAVVGAALIEVIRNSLILLGISTFWQGTFVGSFIIIAVLEAEFRWAARPSEDRPGQIECGRATA